MNYSVRKTLKTAAAGLGVAGLLGAGAWAEEYQNPAGTTTEPTSQQEQQGGAQQSGGMSRQYQTGSQSEMRGSRETASTSQTEQKGERQAQGTIRTLHPDSKMLSLKGPRMHRDFAWSQSTQVLRNGKQVGAEELKKGERVSVTFRKEGNQLIAQQIVIQERQQARAGKRSHRGY